MLPKKKSNKKKMHSVVLLLTLLLLGAFTVTGCSAEVSAISHAEEKKLPDLVFRLLKFGKFQSGTVRNALSAHTHMEGSLRAFQDEIFDGLAQGLSDIGRAVEKETGCTVKLHLSDGYPAVMNPPELYDRVRGCVPFRELESPSMTAEDFSWYQKTLPGLFFFLGLGDVPALHTDTFDFDESILLKGADFFEKLAENYQ